MPQRFTSQVLFSSVPHELLRQAVDPYIVTVYAWAALHGANNDGCWCSVATLAAETHIGHNAVRRSLRWLEAHGWLEALRRPGYTTLWQVNLVPVRPTPTGSDRGDPSLIREAPPTRSGRGPLPDQGDEQDHKNKITRRRKEVSCSDAQSIYAHSLPQQQLQALPVAPASGATGCAGGTAAPVSRPPRRGQPPKAARNLTPETHGRVPSAAPASAPRTGQQAPSPGRGASPQPRTLQDGLPAPSAATVTRRPLPAWLEPHREQLRAWAVARHVKHPSLKAPVMDADTLAVLQLAQNSGVLQQFLQQAADRGLKTLTHNHRATILKLAQGEVAAEGFERLRDAYMAVEKRVSSQSTTPARAEFGKVLSRGFTVEQLLVALRRELDDRQRQEKAGDFVPLLPDLARWLRDGRFEAYLTTSQAGGQAAVVVDEPEPRREDFPDVAAWHEAQRTWRLRRWGGSA